MAESRREFDVAVVGLGGLGSAAAYWLARRGATVLGLEQFELGHHRGASHDQSRIIRRSYHTPHYVALTAGAYDAWATVAADAAQPIVTTTGGVDLFPAGSDIDHRHYTDSLGACGVPFEWLDGAELRRRWPAFAGGSAVADDTMAIHQPDTGIVSAARSTAIMQRLAVDHGAVLRDHTAVAAIRPTAGEVDIITGTGTHRCGAVVLACDAWTNRLLEPLDHALPLVVLREQVSYFSPVDAAPFQPGRFPVWIWMDDPSYYGFPVYGDAQAIKAGEDCGGAEVDADTRTFDPDPAAEARLGGFVRCLVGDVAACAPRSVTCLYTLTADRDFVLDHLPDHDNVFVALGAAHGFKFASWFGRTLAELALDGASAADLAPFAIDRPTLHATLGREAWLV